jgi:hypothetical protein
MLPLLFMEIIGAKVLFSHLELRDRLIQRLMSDESSDM